MKRMLFVVLAVFVICSAASAQAPKPISLYFGGALSMPNSPEGFTDFYKTGFHGSAAVGYPIMPSVQLIGKIEYHRFALDVDDRIFDGEGITGGHNNFWMFGADARYAFGVPSAPMKPFLLGGIGMARISTDVETNTTLSAGLSSFQADPVTDFYFNIGGGLEMKAGPMWSLFGQIRYVSVATEGESSSFIPITIGVKFF